MPQWWDDVQEGVSGVFEHGPDIWGQVWDKGKRLAGENFAVLNHIFAAGRKPRDLPATHPQTVSRVVPERSRGGLKFVEVVFHLVIDLFGGHAGTDCFAGNFVRLHDVAPSVLL